MSQYPDLTYENGVLAGRHEMLQEILKSASEPAALSVSPSPSEECSWPDFSGNKCRNCGLGSDAHMSAFPSEPRPARSPSLAPPAREFIVAPTTAGGNETVVKEGIYMSRKPFSELRSQMSPESQARAEARTQEMLASLALPEPEAAPPHPYLTLVRQLEYLRTAMRDTLQLSKDAPDEDIIDQANEHAEWLSNYEIHMTAIAKAADVRLNGSEYQWSEATRAIVDRIAALAASSSQRPDSKRTKGDAE